MEDANFAGTFVYLLKNTRGKLMSRKDKKEDWDKQEDLIRAQV